MLVLCEPHTAVGKLVAGPGVYIRNECVALYSSIIDGDKGDDCGPARATGSG